MTPGLSPITQQLVVQLFEPQERAEATGLLIEDCGNTLPFCEKSDEYQLERIRFAALRVSIGYIDGLKNAIAEAKKDWRDLLVWARFAESLTVHREWAEAILSGNSPSKMIILMGVTGCGKTRVGSLLANTLNWMYYETDHFLSTPDFNRILKGESLSDEHIQTWLAKILDLIKRYLEKRQSAILAFTGLKKSQRDELRINHQVQFVYLKGERALIEARQKNRKADLPYLQRLAYESDEFEEPQGMLTVGIEQAPPEIVKTIRDKLNL